MTAIRQVSGTIAFDSGNTVHGPCLRSLVDSERMLILRAEQYSVDLTVQPGRDGHSVLLGQVIDNLTGMPPRRVEVRGGSGGESEPADEHGRFTIRVAAEGRALPLRIDLGDLRLRFDVPLACRTEEPE